MRAELQCEALLEQQKTLTLSTVNPKGMLETSVTPFLVDDGHFYIYISELAQHTQNLLSVTAVEDSSVSSPVISGLIVKDEAETEQPFARERLAIQFQVNPVETGSQRFLTVMTRFEARFGEVVRVLQGLPDFHLFELTPVNGQYVRGFGQAFAFEGAPCKALRAVQRR